MADRATGTDPEVIRAAMAETRRHLQEGVSALLDRLSGTDSAPSTQGGTTVAKASGKPAKKAASAKAGKTGSAAKKPAAKSAAKTTRKPAAKAAAKKPAVKAVARTTKKAAATKPKTLLKKAVKAAKNVLVDVGEGALAGAVQGAAGAAAQHLGAAAEKTEQVADSSR